MLILTQEEKQAVKECKKLKAYKIRDDNNEENFSDIYYHVLHEADMYEWGEETDLKKSGYIAAKQWLLKYQYLSADFKNIKL